MLPVVSPRYTQQLIAYVADHSYTLAVFNTTRYRNQLPVFSSTQRWLHPLVELQRFIATVRDVTQLIIIDSIIGGAAAVVLSTIAPALVLTPLITETAQQIFDRFSVNYRYIEKISSIGCKTERLVNINAPLKNNYFMVMGIVNNASIAYNTNYEYTKETNQ